MEVILRPWRQADAEDVLRYANNEKIACNLRNAFPFPYTLTDARNFVKSCMEGDEACQLCRAIEADGRAVGSIALFRGSADEVYCMTAELGYWLAEEYWGRGIMTQAVRQICGEGVERWEDLVRVYAQPFAHNTASRRVLEKAGFTLEGVMRGSVCKYGVVHDACMYALLTER